MKPPVRLVSDWRSAHRVVIHTSKYRAFDGTVGHGGRIRVISDLIAVVRGVVDVPIIVVQKGEESFEVQEPDGTRVIGIKAGLNARGDHQLGRGLSRILEEDDALLYASGAQGAYPYFFEGAKGLQHGIGWDGPYGSLHRGYHNRINKAFAKAMSQILTVDTNFINWLRQQGAAGIVLAEKCHYLPNYADLDALGSTPEVRDPHTPLRILYARRFDPKRGPFLFLDTLSVLQEAGVDFEARMFSVGGHEALAAAVDTRELSGRVSLREASMSAILSEYSWADISVVPTVWSEGTSLAAVEALCAGVPVITTPVGGLANVVVPKFNGDVVPPTATSLAEALVYASDKETYRTLRANCISMRPSLGKARWAQGVRDFLFVG
jgi:glycosyltransferase involved in cell wall biosynthesis